MIFLLYVLFVAVLLFGTPAVAIIALRRASRLEARVKSLETVVANFGSAGAAGSAPSEQPFAEPEAEAEVETPPVRVRDTAMESAPPSVAPPPAFDRPFDEHDVRGEELPPRPAAEPQPRIEWEQWLGVRGAALLGGIVLALAGILLFRYSVEQGILSPQVRVALATIVGLACVGATELKWRREHSTAAAGLAGGGLVILYAAFWAAKARYDLIGFGLAFTLMALVTVVCCLVAVRHRALPVAWIGLVGGFATPLMLSSGSDRPLGLFGYVLLLDLGFLAVARMRKWSSLLPASLFLTVGMQLLWIFGRMRADGLLLGLGVIGSFAVLYAFAGRTHGEGGSEDDRRVEGWTQAAALLFPFAIGSHLAARSDLGEHLWPFGALLVVLAAATSWLADRERKDWLALAAAAGSLAVTSSWMADRGLSTSQAWEAAVVAIAVSAVFHGFFEWKGRSEEGYGGRAKALATASGGFLALTIGAMLHAPNTGLWPWLLGWCVLGASLSRAAHEVGRIQLHWVATVGPAVGLAMAHAAHSESASYPSPAIFLALLVLAAVAFRSASLAAPTGPSQQEAIRGAGGGALLLLASLFASNLLFAATPILALATTLLLSIMVVLAGVALGSGGWLLGGTMVAALVQTSWSFDTPDLGSLPMAVVTGLVFQTATLAVFAAAPFAAPQRFAGERRAWVAAALAGPAWLLSMRHLFEHLFGDRAIGIVPLALAAVAIAVAWRGRAVMSADVRQSALAWLLGAASALVAIAIPLQLEKEWVTIGWALQGAALVGLWQRLRHPGLKYFGVGLLLVAGLRLVANPEVFAYYPRSGRIVFNWMLYTYLVPAGAAAVAAIVLARHEVESLVAGEQTLYRGGVPIGAALVGATALAVVFVWINLAVADAFSSGNAVRFAFERSPGRDLTLSLAWALYALSLLALGVRFGVAALRWASLVFVLLTVGKVFLYDLGELEDLYRVASLVGLAISLMLVSVAYQRFVFRADQGRGDLS